jgi:hypothetical protein
MMGKEGFVRWKHQDRRGPEKMMSRHMREHLFDEEGKADKQQHPNPKQEGVCTMFMPGSKARVLPQQQKADETTF